MGFLPSLIGLLRSSSSLDIGKYTTTLLNAVASKVLLSEVIAAFSSDEKSRHVLRESGGIPISVELLFSENVDVQLHSSIILSNFALDPRDSGTFYEQLQ